MKFTFDAEHFEAMLTPFDALPPLTLKGATGLRGTVETYDPFPMSPAGGSKLTLNVEFYVADCVESGRRVLLGSASPKARPDPDWEALDDGVAGYSPPAIGNQAETIRAGCASSIANSPIPSMECLSATPLTFILSRTCSTTSATTASF
jgi:hypothetical protein